MKHLTLAKPYSDAAFLFAKEHKQIDLWHRFLSEMAGLLMDAEIQNLIKHPKLSNDALIEILSNSFANITPPLKNFLKVLGENQRLNILPEISELFEEGAFRSKLLPANEDILHPCHPAGNVVELWLRPAKSV